MINKQFYLQRFQEIFTNVAYDAILKFMLCVAQCQDKESYILLERQHKAISILIRENVELPPELVILLKDVSVTGLKYYFLFDEVCLNKITEMKVDSNLKIAPHLKWTMNEEMEAIHFYHSNS